MKGKLRIENSSMLTFRDIPVGAWFIHESDLRSKAVTPYLKVSDTGAYHPATVKVYSYPEYFRGCCGDQSIYAVVRMMNEPEWGIKYGA